MQTADNKVFWPYHKKLWIELGEDDVKKKIEGERSIKRTPIRWINQIRTITGYPLENAIRLAKNRKRWKEIVTNIN